jgi:hypothetical protein
MVFKIDEVIGSTVIFLQSAGSTPTPAVEEAAKSAKKNLSSVSMGQVREELVKLILHNPKLKENVFYFRIAN